MKIFLISMALIVGLFAQPHIGQTFDAALFKKAKKEQKIIMMDLEAVWCHWCHVMDETTYKDKEVKALLDKYFLFVKVDHDARPDLAQRYREYGWPATIFFDKNGKEIVKRSGYIEPKEMVNLLKSIVKNPTKEEENKQAQSFVTTSLLSKGTKNILLKRHDKYYDDDLGGLKIAQKYLEEDSIAYAMSEAARGNKAQEKRAKKTLDAAMKLIDPVWGGAYQYSTHQDWDHAHYEKIMRVQSRYIKIYALAAKQFKSKKYLQASKDVAKYVLRFLKANNGAFYVSQDADLTQGQKAHDYFTYNDNKRLSLGMPKIDKHLYASSQGEMIEALAYLYEASYEAKYLTFAKQSAEWTLKNRFVNGGGFSHDKRYNLLYLDDNIAMGRGLLSLYRTTGEVRWLRQASKLGYFLARNFKAPKAGILTATDNGTPIKPVRDLDQNIQAARFMNLLAQYTGKTKHKSFAKHIMKYLVNPDIALSRITEAGILLCDYEFNTDPMHLTVNGNKKDKRTLALRQVALDNALWYARIDLLDLKKSKAYNPDVEYPKLSTPAAFICTNGRCSLSLITVEEFQETIEKFK